MKFALSEQPDPVVEWKPTFGGFTVNVFELLRRFQRRRNPVPEDMAGRFCRAFREHEIAENQIQRFLPQFTPDKFESRTELLRMFTNETLGQASQLLGIRREWLEGDGGQIYPYHSCYKQPRRFFEHLSELECRPVVAAVYAGKPMTRDSGFPQESVLIVAEPIGLIGDEDIYRYHVYGDAWYWDHPPCRIQLKAMARLCYLRLGINVPLYRVSAAELESIREGRSFPRGALSGPLLTEPSLEDFGLALGGDIPGGESRIARESEEVPHVLDYIAFHGLDKSVPAGAWAKNKRATSEEVALVSSR